MQRFEGRLDLLHELLELLSESGPPLLDKLRGAIATQDANEIQYAAHSIKGMVSTFGATACADAALNLEKMGREADLAGAAAGLATLEAEFKTLMNVAASVLPPR